MTRLGWSILGLILVLVAGFASLLSFDGAGRTGRAVAARDAAAPGRVEKLFLSEAGGTTLYQRSPDRRLTFYYAHLAGYAPGIAEGQRVRAGQTLGYVGDSGNAGAGNYHLHFGISRTTPDERWYQGQAVDPYPLLARAARSR